MHQPIRRREESRAVSKLHIEKNDTLKASADQEELVPLQARARSTHSPQGLRAKAQTKWRQDQHAWNATRTADKYGSEEELRASLAACGWTLIEPGQ
jgi:hypothetical protein